MDLREITENQKSEYNKLVTHVMQSWQWGEARKKLGTKLLRYGLFENDKLKVAFCLTFHKIPLTNKYVGYLPKGPFPNKELSKALKKISQDQNCAFIKIEPNITIEQFNNLTIDKSFSKSPKPLFTKHNFVIDLSPSEEELLKLMHQKTRYNIRVAQKHNVLVEEKTDDEAFEIYLKLYFETTKRQNYHGHNQNYHKLIWKTLKSSGMARLLIATYNNKPLTAWMLLNFQNTLYYPYGGSSIAHREVMANNLIAWEAIKLGKKLNLKKFDMWGALGPNPNPKDPWIGFHNFKKGYGGQLVEYIGTFDLVLNWPIYILFTLIDKLMPLKILLLKILS
jgi:lipid II:glycine glycyltransferase (peptidoglycan interpeptide bridge formation enzyme)